MENRVEHLYIHIPFCPKKCSYCAFTTHVGSLKLMEPYLSAVLVELERQAAGHPGGPLRTVYFGGGTPSLMTPVQAGRVLQLASRLLGLASDCEVTLEAHPGTVSAASLKGFRGAGVTRISFGAESLQRTELDAVGREHSPQRISRVVRLSRGAGFETVNLDLMYGLPRQMAQSWRGTLCRALDLGPEHLSLYPLAVEPRTVFARKQREGSLTLPVEESVADMYHNACHLLAAAGYEHYEVANWALPGHRCRHNLAYWHNRPHFAVGVGAHGFVGGRRWENVRQVRRYLDLVAAGLPTAVFEETVDEETARIETIMLRTRLLADGLPLADIRTRFGDRATESMRAKADGLLPSGLISLENERIRISERAALLGNEIWQRLI